MAQDPNEIIPNEAPPANPANPVNANGANGGDDNRRGGNGGAAIEPNGISAFNPRVVLLGLFLFLLLVLSTNLLAKLMMADTSGRTVAAVCKERLGPPPAATPAATPASNPAASNTGTNTASPASNPTGNPAGNSASNPTGNPASNPAGSPTSNPVGSPTGNPATSPGAAPVSTPSPAASPAGSPPALPDIVVINTDGLIRRVFSWIGFSDDRCLTSDGYLFLVVLFAGMVGATLRSIGALYWHLGVGDFSFRWTWFYLFQPFFGGALGLVFFLVLRGGFSSGTVGKGNVFTFAAVSALTGLFSENAMAKLKTVAESLLQATPAKTQDAKGSIDDGKAKKDADASKG